MYSVATGLKRRHPTIGVLVGWQVYGTPSPFSYLTPIFRGICAAAKERDCSVLLACGMGPSADPSDPPRPAWPSLEPEADFVPVGPWNTDGLIVVNPVRSQLRSKYIQDLRANGHPVMFIGKGETGPTIAADNAGGILQAIQHLAGHGHQRIAFIAGNPDDMEGDSGERLRAYYSAVQQFGLETSRSLVVYGRHTFDGGCEAMQQLLANGVQFSAIAASNDESALGAMRALKEAGQRIPHDVAMIGFDDRPEAIAEVPSLSSVRVPLFTSGYQALALLLESLQGKEPSARSFRIPARLSIRHSCGCRHSAALKNVPGESSGAPVQPGAEIALEMTQRVLVEARHLEADQVLQLCQQLIEAFIDSVSQNEPEIFERAIDNLFWDAPASEDDIQAWQAAISLLRRVVPWISPSGAADSPGPVTQEIAQDILDGARIAIGESLRQHHSQYVFRQAWTINRIGALNARLLTAVNEPQIFEVLSNHLPTMGIFEATLGFFEAEEDDPVKWSQLYRLGQMQTELRAPTHQFPPEELYSNDQTFSLALLPLVSQTGIVGFTAFDTANIELLGAVTQQIAAAINNAHLHAEAAEGRKLAEAADRLKGRFLSIVSHELRTPLNLIVGLSDILLQTKKVKGRSSLDPHLKDIEQIQANAQHLGRLIQDVLDLASSDAGQLRFNSERLDLSETLKIITVTGRQLAEEKGLAWNEFFPEDGPWVWGDRTRLRQIVLNLISNAVKFTSQGEVRLKVETQSDYALVSVSDTGVGIPLDEQQIIFGEFRRSERTLSRGYGGMGLGLAITRRLVELHGGEIGVQSSGEEGAGSTFFFKLPILQTETSELETAISSIQSRPIVLLGHHADVGRRLSERLTRQGFEVQLVQTDSVEDWFTHLPAVAPGAIVIDVSLTPNRGWQFLKQLKDNSMTRDVPVLFYSFGLEKGALLEFDYLTKPVTAGDLAQTLEQHALLRDPGAKDKTLLIVDDDPATLEMHIRIAQSQSVQYRTLKARNGREALTIMEAEQPDIVLLDLMMPELDGFGVLEAMRNNENTHDIPVIVLTGQALTEPDMSRLNRSVATVLEKGLFSVEDTLAHIEAALVGKRKLGSEAQRLVRRAMAYLHEHYAEPLSRDDLARHVGMSNDYLTYCFRKELGTTPIAYLNRYRINQAKLLLAGGQKSITAVALAVGFSDSGYFSRVFRREVGVSPEVYRRN